MRHAGVTILMTLGVPDPIVRKVTGHASENLGERQHAGNMRDVGGVEDSNPLEGIF
jgi:hypothetical protein